MPMVTQHRVFCSDMFPCLCHMSHNRALHRQQPLLQPTYSHFRVGSLVCTCVLLYITVAHLCVGVGGQSCAGLSETFMVVNQIKGAVFHIDFQKRNR